MSDCENAMEMIEKHWRTGKTAPGGGCQALTEAINAVRKRLELVVFMHVKSHEGCSPNAMADACAMDGRTARGAQR